MKFRTTTIILIPMTNNYIDDPRILRGMEKQLKLRQDRLQAGEKSIGWKVGFGAPLSMQKLHLARPLVGFLTDKILLPSASSVSIAGWTKPVMEPEVAVHIGTDITGGTDIDAVRAAIVSLGPAIEVADVHFIPEDIEEILADNIFNRHVILGKTDSSRAGGYLTGLIGYVSHKQEEFPPITDLQALTGDMIELVKHVANTLSLFGEMLRAGDVIITGSIIPPLSVATGDSVSYKLESIDALSVKFV